VGLLVVLLAAAVAERPSVALTYSREGAATGCPERARLEDAVSSRLGYVPFSTQAPTRLDVALEGGAQGLRASIRRISADGNVTGTRALNSNASGCDSLFEALAVTVALVIDPLFDADRPPPPPPPVEVVTPRAPPPEVKRAPEPVEVAKEVEPTHRLWLSAGAAGGLLPSWAPVIALGVQRRWTLLSVGLEVSGVVPVRAPVGLLEVESGSLACTTLLGFHLGVVTVGPVLTLGATRVEGRGTPTAQGQTVFRLEAGARAALQVPLGGAFSWLVQVEGVVSVRRLVLVVGDEPVWSAPLGGVVASTGVSLRL
jgi:hypothetical protein